MPEVAPDVERMRRAGAGLADRQNPAQRLTDTRPHSRHAMPPRRRRHGLPAQQRTARAVLGLTVVANFVQSGTTAANPRIRVRTQALGRIGGIVLSVGRAESGSLHAQAAPEPMVARHLF